MKIEVVVDTVDKKTAGRIRRIGQLPSAGCDITRGEWEQEFIVQGPEDKVEYFLDYIRTYGKDLDISPIRILEES